MQAEIDKIYKILQSVHSVLSYTNNTSEKIDEVINIKQDNDFINLYQSSFANTLYDKKLLLNHMNKYSKLRNNKRTIPEEQQRANNHSAKSLHYSLIIAIILKLFYLIGLN